jgi:hypothetical protein
MGLRKQLSVIWTGRDFDPRYCTRAGIVRPILGLTPARCALQGRPCGRPNSFQTNLSLRRQDAGANIGAADGPKGEGRDARSQPKRVLLTLSLRQTQKRDLAVPFLGLAEREGFEPSIEL